MRIGGRTKTRSRSRKMRNRRSVEAADRIKSEILSGSYDVNGRIDAIISTMLDGLAPSRPRG